MNAGRERKRLASPIEPRPEYPSYELTLKTIVGDHEHERTWILHPVGVASFRVEVDGQVWRYRGRETHSWSTITAQLRKRGVSMRPKPQ